MVEKIEKIFHLAPYKFLQVFCLTLIIMAFSIASNAKTVIIPQFECSIDIPDGWEWRNFSFKTADIDFEDNNIIELGNNEFMGYGNIITQYKTVGDLISTIIDVQHPDYFQKINQIAPNIYTRIITSKIHGYNSIDAYLEISPNKILNIVMFPSFKISATDGIKIITEYIETFEKMVLYIEYIKYVDK